jgi:hypothetical protein
LAWTYRRERGDIKTNPLLAHVAPRKTIRIAIRRTRSVIRLAGR